MNGRQNFSSLFPLLSAPKTERQSSLLLISLVQDVLLEPLSSSLLNSSISESLPPSEESGVKLTQPFTAAEEFPAPSPTYQSPETKEVDPSQQKPDVERDQPSLPVGLWGKGHSGVGQKLSDRIQKHAGNWQ